MNIERSSYTEVKNNEQPMYYGFGGWLILLAIGLIATFISSILYLLDEIYPLITRDDFPYLVESYPMWGFVALIMIIHNLGMVILIGISGYLCLKKRKAFIRVMVVFFLFNLAMSEVIVLSYLTLKDDSFSGILISIIQPIIITAIWIPYMLKSKRVKNTYTL